MIDNCRLAIALLSRYRAKRIPLQSVLTPWKPMADDAHDDPFDLEEQSDFQDVISQRAIAFAVLPNWRTR